MTLLVLTCLLFYLIGCGFITKLLLNPLQLSFLNQTAPQWKQHNVIILLGGGAVKLPQITTVQPNLLAYGRINKAASLYFSCINAKKACTLIISGGDVVGAGESEASVYRNALLALNVKNQDIVLEQTSKNTYQNALYTSALLKQRQVDNIILVTSGFHMRRALSNFSYFGILANPESADYLAPLQVLTPVSYNFALADFAIHEYLGILQFPIYNLLGWNVKPSSDQVRS